MRDKPTGRNRVKRPPKPLDSARLEELAVSYVARFSTTQAKLEAYLRRKLRERGWDDESHPRIEEISARYVELGYVDDAAYARSKASSLLSRGYGSRRVDQALYAAGIDQPTRSDNAPDVARQREAALVMARKRRFGPFFIGKLERDRREKQVAAMLRAGHGFDCVRAIIDASSVEAAERWVAEAQEEGFLE